MMKTGDPDPRCNGRCCAPTLMLFPSPCGNCKLGLIHATEAVDNLPPPPAQAYKLTCDSCDNPLFEAELVIAPYGGCPESTG